MKTLDLHVYTKYVKKLSDGEQKNVFEKVEPKQAIDKFYEKGHDAAILFGVTFEEKVFSFGDVFINEKTNELLITTARVTNHMDFIGFGFFVFKNKSGLNYFLTMNFNDLCEYVRNTKSMTSDKFIYVPITTYLKDIDSIVYKGNFVIEKLSHDNLVHYLIHEWSASPTKLSTGRQILNKYNKEVHFIKELKNEMEMYAFDELGLFEVYDIEELQPKLGLVLESSNTSSVVLSTGYYESIRVGIKDEKSIEINPYFAQHLFYMIDDDFQSSVLFSDNTSISSTKDNDSLIKEELREINQRLTGTTNQKVVFEKDSDYYDYYLQFI